MQYDAQGIQQTRRPVPDTKEKSSGEEELGKGAHLLTAKQTRNFWTKVNKREVDECWNWTGGLASTGYGSFGNGPPIPHGAHRTSWLLRYGEIPKGLWVLHKCDNRACVNPDHLFLGTNLDNIMDRNMKGRTSSGPRHSAVMRPAKGESNAGAKLTQQEVLEIRGLCAQRRLSHETIGAMYGVRKVTVYRISSRRYWRHLP